MADTPEHPHQGGSYRRDPITGALTQVHQTAPAAPDLSTDPAPAADATTTNAPAADAGASQEA